VNSWLDIAPAYLNFAIRFLRRPSEAFGDAAHSGTVSRDLTSILGGGVALSYLIAFAMAPAQLREDPSWLIRWLTGVDYYAMPLLGLVAAVMLGIAVHWLGTLYAALSRAFASKAPGPWDPHLGGRLEDSVNAALGFAAIFLPLASAVLSVAAWVRVTWFSALLGLLMGVFVFVYFSLALAATHPDTGCRQAVMAMCGGLFLAFLAWQGWLAFS